MRAPTVRPDRRDRGCGRVGRPETAASRQAGGFALIEVMITILLVSVGLLGMAGLHARTVVAEMESYQRTQAVLLAADMADRLAAHKSNAAQLVGDDYGAGPVEDCSGMAGYAFDRCRWNNALRGGTEMSGGAAVGTLLAGRGCIAAQSARQYRIVVSWQGLAPTGGPGAGCGQEPSGTGSIRRAVVLSVMLADLGAVR